MDDKDNASIMDESTKLTAYYIWLYTKCQDPAALWHCAEDLASFFERCRMYAKEDLGILLKINRQEKEYRTFIRHIAFRLYTYTGIREEDYNWYAAEKLLENEDWQEAVTKLAHVLKEIRENGGGDYARLLSPEVKSYYESYTATK